MKERLKSYLKKASYLDRFARTLWALVTLRRFQKGVSERLHVIDQRFEQIHKALQDTDTARFIEKTEAGHRFSTIESDIVALRDHIHTLHEKAAEQARYLAALDRRTAENGNIGHPPRAAHGNRSQAIPTAEGALDFLYAQLEERFRGSSVSVGERQKTYLASIAAAIAETGKPLVDLGAGRGEWLEIARDAGIEAQGIDTNAIFVAEGRAKGLALEQADILTWLGHAPANSLGAVTGFHIVEHLPPDMLVAVIDAVLAALAPGGCFVVETPNPNNLLVATRTFHLDPTHRAPLPSELTRFLFEARGFLRVEVRHLHPYPDAAHIPATTPEARLLNELLYSAQDYAVIGYKSRA